MQPETILLEYRAMRWDGTMESADQICELLNWLDPWWDIMKRNSPRHGLTFQLSIHEVTPGSNSKTWRMEKNQLLACHVDEDGRYYPEKVIDDAEQVRPAE